MKEYEVSNNGKVLGKVNVFKDNLNKDFKGSFIESKKTNIYLKFDKGKEQTYILEFIVNDVDELYDIVSKYIFSNDKIFETIEEIKKYNNIKAIKKNTIIKVVVPKNYVIQLNKNINDIDISSLLLSKIHFIKSVIPRLDKSNEIIINLNNVINEYNKYINSIEYEFLEEEEKDIKINEYIKMLDKLIFDIEENTSYKYGKDYIVPIKIN